jgi:hypothetical protein
MNSALRTSHTALRNPIIRFAIALILVVMAYAAFAQERGPWADQPIGMGTPGTAPDSPASPDIAPANAPDQVATGVTDTIINLANQHPIIASILILLGSLRLVIKPLMAGARLWTKSTESTRDDEILNKVEASWLYTAFLFALDWLTSIKLKPTRSAERGARNAAILLCAVVLIGCAGTPTPVGQIGASVGPDGQLTNVIGGIAWDVSTNVTVTANGQLDGTGNWSAGILITFKAPISVETAVALRKAGAELVTARASAPVFVIPNYWRGNTANIEAIEAVLKEPGVSLKRL